MDLNIKIKNISLQDISLKKGNVSLECASSNFNFKYFKCLKCNYWFEINRLSKLGIIEELQKSQKFLNFFKSKLFEIKNNNSHNSNKVEFFIKNGGKIKIAYVNKNNIIGAVVYGDYYLFPKLKEFFIYPPDGESIFIACMFIEPEYEDFGIGERLLLSIEKDALERGRKSIEAIAKRQNEDIDEEELENIHFIPLKFLIKNGFLIKKNDEYFPLLRLDLTTIEKVTEKEQSLFERLFSKRELTTRSPITKNCHRDV